MRKHNNSHRNSAVSKFPQIAYADRIVLNKTDLVSGAQVAALTARLGAINKMASVKRAQRSKVGSLRARTAHVDCMSPCFALVMSAAQGVMLLCDASNGYT